VIDSDGGKRRFATTRWSLVEAAIDSHAPGARDALAAICENYWPPVYSFIRSQGHDVESAKDLTQGFFAAMLEKKYLRVARQDRGRFRSFLLICVKRFLANERDRERAIKRGAGRRPIPLDVLQVEARHGLEESARESPERMFEKGWALTVIARVMQQLEREAERAGTLERFHLLKPLLDGTDHGSYKQIAEAAGMSEGSLKVAVHRLRRRFGQLLRQEVAQTVSDPEEVDGEIRHMFEVLRL